MPGLPKSIIKKYGVTKKAWAVFRSGRHRRGRSPSIHRDEGGRRISVPRRRRRYAMAGRPRRSFRHRIKSQRIPILPVLGVVGTTFLPALFGGGDYSGAINVAQSKGIGEGVKEFIDVLSIQTTGYKPSDGSNWGWTKPTATWTTIILSALAHYAMNKLGVNRSIAKIPMIGKYISL